MTIHLTQVYFNLALAPPRIPAFRSAFIEWIGREYPHFHNHLHSADSYRYRYPLVQYRSEQGRAGIVAAQDAAAALQNLDLSKPFVMDGKTTTLQIVEQHESTHIFSYSSEGYFSYRLCNWQALNQANYEFWQATPDLQTRIARLNQILNANVVSLLIGFGAKSEQRSEARITDLRGSRTCSYHGVKIIAFEIDFESNIALPVPLGLGKAVSHGFGVLQKNL
ncbi:MAG: hypothetical protein IPL35_12790 [Sphingobacteriales bacterium]|nr:hypothetical protein [Sphingobacteriales bacterium]